MQKAEDIKIFIQSKVGEFRDNTIVLDNAYLLNIKNITDGVLIIFAHWNNDGIHNNVQTIQKLYKIHYQGQIIILDNDCLTPEFQQENFGELCRGYGEIFVIQQGQIVKKFLSKDPFLKYDAYLNTI